MQEVTCKTIVELNRLVRLYKHFSGRHWFLGSLLALASFGAVAVTPSDQNFNAEQERLLVASGETIAGATYRLVSPSGFLAVTQSPSSISITPDGSDLAVMFNYDGVNINPGALDGRITSADGSEFRIVSMEVDTGAGLSTSSNLVVTGYRDSVQVASDTINTASSDSSGSVTYAKNGVGGGFGGTITFNSDWQYIDEIRFTGTDTIVVVDDLDFEPGIPPNLVPTVDANGAAGGTSNTIAFTEDGGAVRIATNDATVTDDGNIAGMTLVLTATPDGVSEVIAYSASLNGGASLVSQGLTGSYNSGTRTYTLFRDNDYNSIPKCVARSGVQQ